MALSNDGVVPTVTPTHLLPSRVALAQFWGGKQGSGYTFIDHGNPEYGLYVRELHLRVLQLPWPLSGVIPHHFARGLLAEAMGISVNWAEFAYKQTHPHQSRTGAFRLYPDFENIRHPLPPLLKVLPRTAFQVRHYHIIDLPIVRVILDLFIVVVFQLLLSPFSSNLES